MASLKNITELPVAESAEGLNLIVHDNGVAKQIAANKVGKVNTVNGFEPDENGNVQIDTTSNWNDLKDKPFYSEMEAVLEKQIIEGFVAGDNGLFFVDYPCELNISLGDGLSVWFDGENYACTIINIPGAPEEILGFGNLAFIGGPESSEPFLIVYVGPGKFMSIGTANPGTSHEIGIDRETVHKLDAKYLSGGSWNDLKDRPFYEESVEVVWVEEQTITIDEDGRAYLTRKDGVDWPQPQTPFEVIFDGVSYKGFTFEDGDMNTHTDFTTEDGYDVLIYDVYRVNTSSDLAGEHTIRISYMQLVTHQIDHKYLDIPVYKGEGDSSACLNNPNNTASGLLSYAEGNGTEASGRSSHAEGENTTASGRSSHAEGKNTTASGESSHAEGNNTEASGESSHAEGQHVTASGEASHAEGYSTTASGDHSHAEGRGTIAKGKEQHVQGRFNIEDTANIYAHIVGNGTSVTKRSNAHTLDWSGIPWYKGRPQFGGTAQDNGSQTVMANGDKELILTSSTEGSTKKFKITVDDSGTLTATEVTE